MSGEGIDPVSAVEHLGGLLDGTPSGVAKLVAAWDGLSPETQIELLGRFKPEMRLLADPLLSKAIRSSNPYVRYLAARQMNYLDRSQHRIARGAGAVLRRREADHVGVSKRSQVLSAEVRDQLVVDEAPVAIERRAADRGSVVEEPVAKRAVDGQGRAGAVPVKELALFPRPLLFELAVDLRREILRLTAPLFARSDGLPLLPPPMPRENAEAPALAMNERCHPLSPGGVPLLWWKNHRKWWNGGAKLAACLKLKHAENRGHDVAPPG